ncbi:uncharacterized protein LOC135373668 [Ornithodoros turicata]|uniref:uncharacterized protein LOC135373668 n=1 Tax=Ornithodoros turicata TaxID=34597 RepID=UPI003138FE02
MTRVPFGTSASPFLLAATLQHHLQNTKGPDEDIAVTLANSFYVHDLLMGADTLDEAGRIAAGAQAIMQGAGMKLSKWSSSAMELQSVFEDLNTDNCNVNKRLGDTEDRKVLGIVWDRTGDHFRFSAEHLLDTMIAATPTKRSVLQTCGKIFDPLGFLAPYTIRAKILFQRIWERGLDWDNELPDDLLQEWKSWCEELPKLGIISLERCLTPVNGTGYTAELHIFTDASPQAYGACVFVRTVDDMGAVKVGLLFAKSRVAPIKKLTLPRLELMGAVIGIRIAKLVRDSLQILSGEPTYWTDSTIVLSWIKGDSSRWKPFVKNRVTEIQSNSDPSQWRHCRGASNPADALTRGLRVDVLAEYKQWFIGPEWMRIAPELWPPTSTQETHLDMVQEEQRVQDVAVNHVQIKTDLLLDPKDYSNYQRILRVTAWIFRFAENCRRRNRKNGPLTAEEMDRAEIFCIKQVQSDAYADEVLALSHGLALQKSSRIAELQPYLDGNGLLRLTGRLQCAEEPEQIKHPILLPKEHELTRHIVEAAHRRTLHGGLQATLSEIREKWWITRARQLADDDDGSSPYRVVVPRKLRIQHKKTSPYHPQANITECINRNLKMMFVTFTSQHHREWDLRLAELAFATRTTVNRSTGFTPAFLNLGREAPFPVENALGLRDGCTRLDQACQYNRGRRNLTCSVGDLVGFAASLADRRDGPFVVSACSFGLTYRLRRCETGEATGPVHISDLKPYHLRERRL